jgi:hypothetical protein
MASQTIDVLVTELARAIAPLRGALSSPEEARLLLNALGWDLPGGVSDIGLSALDVKPVTDKLSKIERSTPEEQQNNGVMLERYSDLLSALIALVQNVRKTMNALSALPALSQDYLSKTHIDTKLFTRLFDYLIIEYIAHFHYRLYCLLVLVGVFDVRYKDADPANFQVEHIAHTIVYQRPSTFISDPRSLLTQVYGWGTANPDLESLLSCFALLLQAFGAEVRPRTLPRRVEERLLGRSVPEAETDPMPQVVISVLKGLGWEPLDVGLVLFGMRPTTANGTDGGVGIFPFIKGTTDFSFPLSSTKKWVFEISTKLDVQGGVVLSIRPKQPVSLQSGLLQGGAGGAVTTGTFAIGLRYASGSSEKTRLFSISSGTRIESSQFRIVGEATLGTDQQDYGFLVEIGSAAIVVSAGEGDGFLQKVLPSGGLRTEFDLAIGWSNRKGLYFRGSAGLEATLPIHKTLLGALTIESIHLSLGSGDSGIDVTVAATASVKLGPFLTSVERIGLKAKLAFPPEGGNLGPAHLELGFKPPSGTGMAIDASVVVGGGYLFFDPDNEQYAGILQVEIQKVVCLKAIGLLTTRMPDGSKGFSLLVIISAEFPPIQLGFGFTLSGVGGLLGVNRTMVVDVLRAGLKNGTLGSILFPQNPVAHAQKILSDLRSIFPVAPQRFVFGPMVRLGWGAKNLITAELGIILELPQPVRLVILGRLTLAIPDAKLPTVLIHLDSLGIIDFDRGDVSLDATLYDSQITGFALTGDMALRLNWGANPIFAVAAGGFNPRFQPPPNFPQLKRMTINLATGDNPRIRLETYLALTANTLQLGAQLDVYGEMDVGIFGRFSASGYMGFDALVHMEPLQFIADIASEVSVKHNGHPLLSAQLHLSLSGPEPLHAWGEVTFDFVVKQRIPFDLTVSTGIIQPPLPSIDPLEKLIEELKAQANWSAQLPRDEHMLVTLRQIEVTDQILAHPLGELTVRQKAVPLEVVITRFGNSRPTRNGPFLITLVRMGDQVGDQPRQTLRDLYPPGQFFEISDEEELARPAFEALPSGCSRIGTTAIRFSATHLKATAQYDTVVVDKLEERQTRKDAAFAYTLPSAVQAALAGLGAAGQSAMRATGSAKYAGTAQQKVKLADPVYVVAGTDDMSWQDIDKKPTYTEAEAARQQKGTHNGTYQVVGAHEVK